MSTRLAQHFTYFSQEWSLRVELELAGLGPLHNVVYDPLEHHLGDELAFHVLPVQAGGLGRVDFGLGEAVEEQQGLNDILVFHHPELLEFQEGCQVDGVIFDCTLQFVELQLLQLVSLQAFILQLIDLLRGLFIQLKLLLQLLFHNLRGLPQRLYQIHVSVHIFEQQPALLLLDALLEVGHQLVDNIDVLLWELAVPAEVVDAEHIAFLF